MKAEAQNRAIAEACGWRQIQTGARAGMWRRSDISGSVLLADGSWPADYVNDLNAMHDAIIAQPRELRIRINGALMGMMCPEAALVLDRTINATAAQRAEAFLRALNLWREE